MAKENPEYEDMVNHDKNTIGSIIGQITFLENDWILFEGESHSDNSDFKDKWEELSKTYSKDLTMND